MSFLAPLYILGGLAISLPIIFHLIRRQPKGQIPFSSLMFLRESPPRLTRRSRLENWPLLLVRAAVLALLAAAFARPLLRTTESLPAEPTNHTTILLVDTSASMRRAGLWQQAVAKANQTIDALRSGDSFGIVSFDRTPRTLMSLEQSERMDIESLRAAARQALASASPTWQATDLGNAIQFAAELAGSRDEATGSGSCVVELISDVPRTGQIEKLQSFAWPDGVVLNVRRVDPEARSNAFVTVLADSRIEPEAPTKVRARITNGSNSLSSSFDVGWLDPSGASSALPIQVPPGESRVLRLPAPPPETTTLRLQGDDAAFDNHHYYAPPRRTTKQVLYIGHKPENPRDSLAHYLRQAPLGDHYRTINVNSISPSENLELIEPVETPLAVIGSPWPESSTSLFRKYIEQGGRILAVLADKQSAPQLIEQINQLSGIPLQVAEADIDDYAMLSRIDFEHLLFEPMSEPPYNDFSKIRVWSHRAVSGALDGWSVLATFDNGHPALLESKMGAGRLLLLTTGWQPDESQLALSTKFVPLLYRLVHADQTEGGRVLRRVGDSLPASIPPDATLTRPDGTAVSVTVERDSSELDSPGVYHWSHEGQMGRFAVNLDPSESRTHTVGDDVLEQFGVKLRSNQPTGEIAQQQQRQLRDRELESRQRIWQWLLAAVLGLIGLETWMGRRAHEPSTA